MTKDFLHSLKSHQSLEYQQEIKGKEEEEEIKSD